MQLKLSTSPSHSILTPGRPVPASPSAWQGSHWSAKYLSHRYDSTREKKSRRKRDSIPESSAIEANALTTRPTRRSPTGTTLASGAAGLGSIPAFAMDLLASRVIPVTLELVLQWLPCQAPGVAGSALGVVGPVSGY